MEYIIKLLRCDCIVVNLQNEHKGKRYISTKYFGRI